MDSLQVIRNKMRQFVEERDWLQFHSPKNIAMALSGEAAEIIEHFQWLTEAQSRNLDKEQKQEVAMEIADVQLYLVRLADELEIDIHQACEEKMTLNAEKYSIEKSKGRATKYNKL